jgi:hypothetical protein
MSDWADIVPSTRGLGAVVGLAQTALGSPGGTITVDVGGQLVTVQVARNITSLAAGDLVSLVRHGSTWYATAQLGTAAVDLTAYSTDVAPNVRPDYVTGQYVLGGATTRPTCTRASSPAPAGSPAPRSSAPPRRPCRAPPSPRPCSSSSGSRRAPGPPLPPR